MKSRVRTIVVLVCVFVVLPVVGGLVYLSRISVQDAARYYAEAVAQGRFEDALSVESTDADSNDYVGRGKAVDLRHVQPSSVGPAVTVTGMWVHSGLDSKGRQGVNIEFSANGRSTTRVVYLERSVIPRPHVGSWRVVMSAARPISVSPWGYASDVSVGGVSLGAVGGIGKETVAIPPRTDDLWHAGGGGRSIVYAYPGVYDVSVTQLSEYTEYAVDSAPAGSTVELVDADTSHEIDIRLNEETQAWHRDQFAPLITACIRGETPQQALCPDVEFPDAESLDVGEPGGDPGKALHAHFIRMTVANQSVEIGVRSEICFDEAGERYIVFMLLHEKVDGRSVR